MSLFYGTEIRKPKKVYISEDKLSLLMNEDVFASGKKGRNKIQLSYNKRLNTNRTRNTGSLNPAELLNTGKMDQTNSDTYEVPLKGGIMSYNITSIRGTEIMHYFKNKFAKMDIDLDGDGMKESYDLFMEDSEYKAFFNQFYSKVNNVISSVVEELYNKSKGKVKFSGVSIFPVPSSSDFNVTIANQLASRVKLANLGVQVINPQLFHKDLTNLQKDEDFINKNKVYYGGKMFSNGNDNTTHDQYIDSTLNRFSKIQEVKPLIDDYNKAFDKLNNCYVVNRERYGDRFGEALARCYVNLNNKLMAILSSLKYGDKSINTTSVFNALKGTKSQVEARKTEDIWRIVKPYLRGQGIKPIVMHKLQAKDFQIKNLSNDVRMGMKNYFQTNNDEEIVKAELEKIKGTVFVIFDDNISGGATLSDICLQAKNLGIEYIIPITFGEMQMKYNLGIGNQVNKPTKSGHFENY